MTIYQLDGTDTITDNVRLCPLTSVYADEMILEFTGGMQYRMGINADEALALITALTKGLSLLRTR